MRYQPAWFGGDSQFFAAIMVFNACLCLPGCFMAFFPRRILGLKLCTTYPCFPLKAILIIYLCGTNPVENAMREPRRRAPACKSRSNILCRPSCSKHFQMAVSFDCRFRIGDPSEQITASSPGDKTNPPG